MGQRVSGRVVLITGGTRGIGRAIALAFASEGAAAVVINYQSSADAAARTASEVKGLGSECAVVRADVADPEQVGEMLATVGRSFGRLDILVNNAGTLIRGAITELSDADWNRTIAVNLGSAFFCIRASLPLIPKSASSVILNLASGGAGMHGQAPRLAHYYAAKAGLVTLSKCLATELAPIRVNCLAPGFIDTGFGKAQPGTKEKVLASTPLARLGQAEDIANAAVFLASDEASFITGHVLTVDGGRTM